MMVATVWLWGISMCFLLQERMAGGVAVGMLRLDSVAESFLENLSSMSSEECYKFAIANWNYQTNITEHNRLAQVASRIEHAKWEKKSKDSVKSWTGLWEDFPDPFVRRQFQLLSSVGTAALPEEQLKEYSEVVSKLSAMYSTAKICDYRKPEKCDLNLNPELADILRNSGSGGGDYGELTHVWKAWRDASGKKMRPLYKEYVRLSNIAARLDGFPDMGASWRKNNYDDDGNFADDMFNLYQQLKPLYMQLHAYVRRKLREVYGADVVRERGPIPANLLGDMWGQWWENIYPMVEPFPGKESIDVTQQMKKLGYTPRKMFELAEDFFVSLNLTRMTESFWKESLLEKPNDRDVVCHASAWDFCNGNDFRIKQCTSVTMRDLVTVHHEMGHIVYYMLYKDLPYVFRNGANPGFHEAVGDVIALSVNTPKHLRQVGLLNTAEDDEEAGINFLLKMALRKVGYLPFAYLVDAWRWRVFSGDIPERDWNCAWWDLRYDVQGVKPPVIRTEEDFDPGAKYHVPYSVGYTRYFVANILQFQFQKALCLKAGEYDPNDPAKPLHKCDIYRSVEAGNAFGDMLALGSSRPWPDVLETLTGERKMDGSVLREYFKPLEQWLEEDNKRHGEFVGWRPDGEYCVYKSPYSQASGL